MKRVLMVLFFIMGMLVFGAKDEIVVNFEYEPYESNLDPQLGIDLDINALIMEGLIRQDEKGKPVPGIAEKWEISEDGLVWTFHLRDAKWENGDYVTANDFKFAWIRALESENAAEYSYLLFLIKGAYEYNGGAGSIEEIGIRVIDDKTLEITLDTPTKYLDSLLTFPVYIPLNEKYYKSNKNGYAKDAGKIMANGSYKLLSWIHHDELVLEKNENYWNKNKIKNEIIRAKLIENASDSLRAFENNEIDFTILTVEQYSKFREDKRLTTYDDGSTWYLEYNLNNVFLSNKKIRQALTMVVDKEELGNILQAMGKPAYGFVPDTIMGENKTFREEAGETYPRYNSKKARELFKEGMKELGLEKAPKVTLIFNDQGNNKKISEYVQKKIKKELGYDLTIEPLPFEERLVKMLGKDFDIVLAGWIGDYNDALSYMDLWITNGGNNHTSYSNPKYDELIQIAQTSPCQKVRMQAMIEAEKLLGDDMPIGMLYYRRKIVLINPRLKNMKFKSLGSIYYLNDAYVK
ncbi:peptide ABC transporter substrate-binding protein [Sebaldella sp. S0638]|uniref:peptide ABC transporter substrate-binding protein n=1 Tax=Sebaldella sp. S0638 TaxID=2957809 RepID=UPI00209F0011|nr:peptide ABC transporter substrate-binding protein [Sebaldella sp. S0638]MCP1223906.1 peptide ABC transporter substrate-binding protein [Sebaldella sp. S0638]